MSESLRDQLQSALGEAHVLERELGGGGMSHVFLAHERALGRQVVVKVLLPELAAGVNVERFRREIQLAAQLQHPHIVPLLSAGEAEGLPYFIMPFVTGESLRARVAREGELPIAETVRILRDVVSALAYAHTRGVVHRDVKPDNVLLSGGVAVVTDFGVAKAVSASSELAGGSSVTSLGVALGTPAYMSPEQAAANPHADHRTDIYSLGVMAYEMLAGLPPFTGRSPQAVLAAHVIEEPPPIERLRPAVPSMLATLVNQCLAKSPADRPQTAAQVMHVLDAIVTPSGGTAPTLVRVPSAGAARAHSAGASPERRRGPGLAFALVATASAVVAGAVLLLRREPSPVAPAIPAPAAPAPAAAPAPVSDSAASTLAETSAAPRAAPAPTPAVAPSVKDGAGHPTARPAAPRPKDRATRAAVPVAEPDSATRVLVPPAVAITPAPAAPTPPVPAPTAPPAPAPAPTPTAVPPAPPADPRPEIGDLVSRYAAAVESGSLANLKQVYPGMTPLQQQGWEQFFRLVRHVKADLALGRLDLSGATAEAQVAGTYTYLNTSTQLTERQPVSFRASLRRDGGAWRIAQVR